MLKRISLLLVSVVVSLLSQPIVKNGSFLDEGQVHGEPPKAWTVEKPASGAWAYVNDDGVLKATSLRFTSMPDAGIVFQKINLAPNTDYALLFWYKNAGAFPTVAIKEDDTAKTIAIITADKKIKGRWYPARKDFRSGEATKCTISISCESSSADAKAFIDCIEIVTKEEADLRKDSKTDKSNLVNIALNKKYTLPVPPDYSHCSDADDAVQLTDGIHTVGYFWTQKSTVGWHRKLPAIVEVDLGQEEPICGVSWNTAAGTAGVFWPDAIMVFTSNDRKIWNLMGDLTIAGTVNKMPPSPNNYQIFDYSTMEFKGCGRYVAFMVTAQAGSPIFCDEIEVYRGDESCRKEPRYKMTFETSPKDFYRRNVNFMKATKRMDYDLKTIAAAISALPESFAERTAGLAEVENLQKELEGISFTNGIIQSTKLPFDDYPVSAKIYAANRYVLRQMGYTTPFIWKSNRWDNLSLIDNPKGDEKAVAMNIEMMRGEVRADTFSISNPTPNPLSFSIEVKGIPSARLHSVIVTDQGNGIPIGSALAPIDNNDGRYDRGGVSVPAGCNVQIWLSVFKPSVKAGKYNGTIHVSSIEKEIPVTLVVHNFDLPERHTLNVGGWQYAATFNDGNRLANYAFMRDFGMNVTWGHSSILPKNPQFDDNGNIVNYDTLDFNSFDSWIKDWPDCNYYCVTHFGSRTEFFGEMQGTPRFKKMLVSYFKTLEKRMEEHSLRPDQLVYLLEDEPRSKAQDKFIVNWLTPLREGGVKVRQFTDPLYDNPADGLPEMYAVNDILCPQTRQLIAGGKPFKEFYEKQREAGRELWLYSCTGPAKNLDPVSYWRLQAWLAFDLKAVGSHFWAFGNTAGTGDSWAAYNQTGTEYGPHFVSKNSMPMASKQSEALRESVQDFEYLTMLRRAIDNANASGKQPKAAVEKAEKALADAIAKAIDTNGQSDVWKNSNKHSHLDESAVMVLRALCELEKRK